MLNPDARSLYTGAVTPPPGYVFDQALATTYSLDPATLLSLPTHIALAEHASTTTVDPIRLLESLRRLLDRVSVYVDHTGMKPPSGSNVLFGLLESMVMPVKAVRGGVFHPKIWLLRFVQPDLDESPLIRLLVLSRNITYDRSWDIALQLEGRPGGRCIAANPLCAIPMDWIHARLPCSFALTLQLSYLGYKFTCCTRQVTPYYNFITKKYWN